MERVELETELERHHADAFGWALRCCHGSRMAAEDALQASYLKVLDGRARFEGRSSFRTWLFGVIRRTAAEQHRSSRASRLLPLYLLDGRSESADPDIDPATAIVRSESTRRLVAALERLPPRQRDLLHLVFYQELTIREAAEVLGVSIGTARTHYDRGKKRVRKLLEEDEHDV
jgi:RNA polymerase sigma-70 factor (ECF subfamily)